MTQQGLSSGKKRRTQTDGLVASALDRSVVLRISIYGAFAAVLGLLVMGAGRQDGPALEAGQGVLVGLLVLIMVVMVLAGIVGFYIGVKRVQNLGMSGWASKALASEPKAKSVGL